MVHFVVYRGTDPQAPHATPLSRRSLFSSFTRGSEREKTGSSFSFRGGGSLPKAEPKPSLSGITLEGMDVVLLVVC